MVNIPVFPYYTLEDVERYLGIDRGQAVRMALYGGVDLSIELAESGGQSLNGSCSIPVWFEDEKQWRAFFKTFRDGDYKAGLSCFSLDGAVVCVGEDGKYLLFTDSMSHEAMPTLLEEQEKRCPIVYVYCSGIWHICREDLTELTKVLDEKKDLFHIRIKPTERPKERGVVFDMIGGGDLTLRNLFGRYSLGVTRDNFLKLGRHIGLGSEVAHVAAVSDEPVQEEDGGLDEPVDTKRAASVELTWRAICAYRSLKAQGKKVTARDLENETEKLFHRRVGKDVCNKVINAAGDVHSDFKDKDKCGLLF